MGQNKSTLGIQKISSDNLICDTECQNKKKNSKVI